MIKLIRSCICAGALVMACGVDVAYAQKQPGFALSDGAAQTLNFTFGGFVPPGEDGRVDGDVLVFNRTFLAFDIGEFKAFTVGGEYLLPIGKYIEMGAGISYNQGSTHSVYTDWLASDGSEIQQELKLRRVPMEFTARVLPFGHSNAVQPYVGGGIAVISWRYEEEGEFIDFDDLLPGADPPIFRDTFSDSGTSVGPVILGGVRYAAGGFALGGEVRWTKAEGDLDPDQFFAPKIDLGGWTYQFTIGLRFD